MDARHKAGHDNLEFVAAAVGAFADPGFPASSQAVTLNTDRWVLDGPVC